MKRYFGINIAVMFAGIILTGVVPLRAAWLEPSDFGPGSVTESFEGLSPNSNIELVGNGAFLRPAVISSYSFGSGVVMTSPVPNSSEEGPTIGDFRLGDASVSFSGGGVSSDADIPSGSAYMISGGPGRDVSVEFTFTADMLRVGAYLGGNVESLTISLFDAADILLKQVHLLGIMPDWKTNFIAIEHPLGIRRVSMDFGPYSSGVPGSQYLLIDELMFEPVPEPATGICLALGSLALLKRRYRRCPKEREQK